MPTEPRQPRRRGGGPVRRLLAVITGLTTAACSVLIGLDELPARPETTGDASAETGRASFCDEADGSLFCDDFDHPGQPLGERWRGMPGFLPSSLGSGDAGAELATPSLPSSAPAALEIHGDVGDTGGKAFFVFVQAVDVPAGTRAVEMSADVRLIDLADRRAADAAAGSADASQVAAAPRVGVMTVVAPSNTLGDAVQVFVGAGHVAATTGTIGDDKPFRGTLISELDYLKFSKSAWVRITIAVGARASVVGQAANGAGVTPACPERAAVAAVWVSVPRQTVGCVEVPDSFSAIEGKQIGVLAGLTLTEPTSARVLIDSVRVNPIR